MNNKTFLEEKEKLKEINNKVLEEEKLIEEELRKSDMNYTMEDIAKGEVLLTRVKKLENIKKIKNVPYFARMDFKEENRDLEKLYIGKISILDNKTAEPIIVDWRAPISNLYYEGKIGSAEYECLGKKIKGDILLKRQYIIEKKQLKKYIDINVTGNVVVVKSIFAASIFSFIIYFFKLTPFTFLKIRLKYSGVTPIRSASTPTLISFAIFSLI